jgi:hypothetical protein
MGDVVKFLIVDLVPSLLLTIFPAIFLLRLTEASRGPEARAEFKNHWKMNLILFIGALASACIYAIPFYEFYH